MSWLCLSAYVVLAGACLNAEMERQTEGYDDRGGTADGPAQQRWRTPSPTTKLTLRLQAAGSSARRFTGNAAPHNCSTALPAMGEGMRCKGEQCARRLEDRGGRTWT